MDTWDLELEGEAAIQAQRPAIADGDGILGVAESRRNIVAPGRVAYHEAARADVYVSKIGFAGRVEPNVVGANFNNPIALGVEIGAHRHPWRLLSAMARIWYPAADIPSIRRGSEDGGPGEGQTGHGAIGHEDPARIINRPHAGAG